MESASALCCLLPKLRQSIALSLTTRLTPSGQLTRHRAAGQQHAPPPHDPPYREPPPPPVCISHWQRATHTILCAGRAAAKRSWPQPRSPAAALSSLSLRVGEARMRREPAGGVHAVRCSPLYAPVPRLPNYHRLWAMRGICRAPPRRSASSSRATARWRASGHVPGVRAGCRRKAAYRGPEPEALESGQPEGLTLPAVATASHWSSKRHTGVLAWVGDSAALHIDMDGSLDQAHKQVLLFFELCRVGAVNDPIPDPSGLRPYQPSLAPSTGDHLRHAAPQPGSTKTAIQPRRPLIYSPICSPADLRACSPVRRTPTRPSASQRGDSVLKRERSPHRAAEGCPKAHTAVAPHPKPLGCGRLRL